MTPEEQETLHHIDTRMVLVENELSRIVGVRRIMLGMSFLFIVQAMGVVYGYGQLNQRMDSVDMGDFQANITTALTVLGDHGSEFVHVRNEMARMQGLLDSNALAHGTLRDKIDARTQDRFYREDARQLRQEIVEQLNELKVRVTRNETYFLPTP